MNVVIAGGIAEIVEKKSRFIAQLKAVHTEDEAASFIGEIRKTHHDARHNCFAYVLGMENPAPKSSDDGEPQGTAGRPILDIISGASLCDAMIVVTRYFGGVLLGCGGLSRAYSRAALQALAASRTAPLLSGVECSLSTGYDMIGKLRHMAAEHGIFETDAQYGTDVNMTYIVPADKKDAFFKAVSQLMSGRTPVLLRDIHFAAVEGGRPFIIQNDK